MATLCFYVVPNAKENRVVGQHGSAIKVKLRARPIEGEANAALCKFLAEELGVPESSIVLEHGRKSRAKILRIDVLDEEAVRARLLPSPRDIQQPLLAEVPARGQTKSRLAKSGTSARFT
jgi:uncharacterized protein (TIGR00251 family)